MRTRTDQRMERLGIAQKNLTRKLRAFPDHPKYAVWRAKLAEVEIEHKIKEHEVAIEQLQEQLDKKAAVKAGAEVSVPVKSLSAEGQ